MRNVNKHLMKQQLQTFLCEDIGMFDVSSELIGASDETSAYVIAKASGRFSGEEVIRTIVRMSDLELLFVSPEGAVIESGDVVASFEGSTRAILQMERVLLNLIQRMSAIATLTSDVITRLDDPSIRVCDTRKTTPGLRMFEKAAVRAGGGFNHRLRLDDAIMIKDNHIVALGGVKEAVARARAIAGHTTPIEVEVETYEDLLLAIEAKPDIIMLDNRTPEELASWSRIVPEGITVEASGGIELGNIHSFKGCGVDYISLGQLTHSVKAFDFSLNLVGGQKYANDSNVAGALR